MQRRKLHFDNVEQVMADIDVLHRDGYQRLGNWSLGEMCDHFSIFAEKSLDKFDTKVPWLFRQTIGRIIFPFILAGKIPKGIKAPPEMEPKKPTSDDPTLSIERLRKALLAVGKATDAQFTEHPFAGKISAEKWRRAQIAHCEYHLGFLIPNPPRK